MDFRRSGATRELTPSGRSFSALEATSTLGAFSSGSASPAHHQRQGLTIRLGEPRVGGERRLGAPSPARLTFVPDALGCAGGRGGRGAAGARGRGRARIDDDLASGFAFVVVFPGLRDGWARPGSAGCPRAASADRLDRPPLRITGGHGLRCSRLLRVRGKLRRRLRLRRGRLRPRLRRRDHRLRRRPRLALRRRHRQARRRRRKRCRRSSRPALPTTPKGAAIRLSAWFGVARRRPAAAPHRRDRLVLPDSRPPK